MRFSIVIPTHNRDRELAAALSSCLAQTYPDFEIVVVDDCSAEPAADICARFADPRIVCLRNDSNLGAAGSRNRGLAAARGDYVTFLDSDDLMLPAKLGIIAREIERASPDVILHRQYRVFERTAEGLAFEILPRRTIGQDERIDEFTFEDGNYYQMNSICVRRELALQVGFRTDLRLYEDQAFVVECVNRAGFLAAIDDALSIYVDDTRASRGSRAFRSAADVDAFLLYARQAMSGRAYAMAAAMLLTETPIYRAPLRVAGAIWNGARAGVPLVRSFLYLFRSMFGAGVTGRLVAHLRARDRARAGDWPSWADTLHNC